ncbi:MAG: N-acetyl-gamma-glutamyl-phosphate reductase [Acidimicrobiia bacterium]
MAYQVGVVGGSGYTGAELLRLLAGHPDIEVVQVTAASNAGATVGSLYPSLGVAYPGLEYVPFDPIALSELDLAFLALPHGESQQLAGALVDTVPHLVDLGADFRLPAADYAQWYGDNHTAPELLDRFAFGLPELFRDTIAKHAHVASPGCYPTAATLALAPLVAGGLVESAGIIVDAMSGVSGAGRALKHTSHFSEVDESVSAYGVLTHRHTAEMELALSAVGGTEAHVLFTPHLVPMVRGIHATCHARPKSGGVSTTSLLSTYRDFYAGEPFVSVVDDPPPTKATTGGNGALVTVRYDERTDSVLAIGVLDNLVKGASGQAIQNANLLLGLPEAAGLSAIGMWP